MNSDYTNGYQIARMNDEELAAFYSGIPFDFQLYDNEYLAIQNKDSEIVDKYCWQDGVLRKLKYKSVESQYYGTMKPRNLQQEFAFDMLQDNKSTIKVITGVYGSGKTILTVVHALDMIRRGLVEKMVWVRNNMEVKDSTQLGALPGDYLQKLWWTVGPLSDHLGGDDNLMDYINNGRIEVQHLGYIRGRDIKNSIIISSEAENLTKEHVQLLIGRVGEGSMLWLDGDHRQTDKAVFKENSGMLRAVERLSGEKLFAHIHLPKSERSMTAALADKLD